MRATAPRSVETTSSRSLWLAAAGDQPTHPTLNEDVTADVAVIGGGIAGATLALALQASGAQVVLVEARRVASGVSGLNTAKVTALQGAILSQISKRHGADAVRDYAQASLSAVTDVARRVEAHGIDCGLERRPVTTYTTDAKSVRTLRREFELAEAAGLPVRWHDSDAGLPFAVKGAIWLDDQVCIQPVRYVHGLIAAFVTAGGRVFEQSRVTRVQDGAPCRLRVESGHQVRADQVAVCTHYPTLDRSLAFARLEAQRSYCVAVDLPEDALPRAMAMGIGSGDRSVQWFDGALIIGGEGHAAGARPSTANAERYTALLDYARTNWPSAGAERARWSAQDPVPYDRLPLIGPLVPGSSRLWMATGWAKWGLSGGTFAARVLSEQMDGRPDEWNGRFSPSRISPRATPEIAKLGASFQFHFLADRVTPAEADSVDEVPLGEARTVRHRSTGKVGVYRDTDGNHHAVSLRCSHLGCLLHFNAAETSWDCPCHGSRFDVDGAVLEGPAVQPLRRYDL